VVSKIEPDRDADTGFAVKDTPSEVNAMLFAAMMRKTPSERLLMGFDLSATARAKVRSSIPASLPETERRRAFFLRYNRKQNSMCILPGTARSAFVASVQKKLEPSHSLKVWARCVFPHQKPAPKTS
jgi:hypothetical protein